MGPAHWREDYLASTEWFVSRCLPEPHSTKAIEDVVGWALETDPETLIVLRAQDVTSARAEARARWDSERTEDADGYVVHQADGVSVHGLKVKLPS